MLKVKIKRKGMKGYVVFCKVCLQLFSFFLYKNKKKYCINKKIIVANAAFLSIL